MCVCLCTVYMFCNKDKDNECKSFDPGETW